MKKSAQPLARGNSGLLAATAAATACLVFLSYPSCSQSFLAWIAWVPFLYAIPKIRSKKAAFLYGWGTGFLFQAGLFYWIYYTCRHGGGLSVGLSAAAWLGLCALLALQFGLWGLCCRQLQKTGWFFPLGAACSFTALEWLHQTIAFYGVGFPWLMWGYTQWNAPTFLQLAAYSGVYGLGFVLVLVNALAAQAIRSSCLKKRGLWLLGAGCIILGVFCLGRFRLSYADKQENNSAIPSIQAAVLQPNIDQYKKWDPEFEQEILTNLADLGYGLKDQGVQLTVWPESAVPGYLLEEKYLSLMENIAAVSQSFQVIGSSVEQGDRQYVGAYLMVPGVRSLQHYKKEKLVPFGEYIPLESWVRRLFPQVDILGEVGLFTAGTPDQPLLNMYGIQLGSTICYEAIFPQLWRRQARQGAGLFVNLTNDAWFFDTAAPHQHFAVNVLRAVETGRPVLRAANTGISAFIDAFGRIRQQTGLFTRTSLQSSVPLTPEGTMNFYTYQGDWLAYLCIIISVAGLIVPLFIKYESH